MENDPRLSRIQAKDNGTSNILSFVAFTILAIGVVLGFVLGRKDNNSLDIAKMVTIIGVSAFSCLMLYALSEIIQVLHDIRRKMYEKDK